MRTHTPHSSAWFLAEFEKIQEAAKDGDDTPKAVDLFMETAIAIAIPLLLALIADLWLAAAMPGI